MWFLLVLLGANLGLWISVVVPSGVDLGKRSS